LEQRRAEQFFWPNRWTAKLDIERAQLRRDQFERPIGNPPDRPQRIIRRHARLERHVTNHRSRLLVRSARQETPFVVGAFIRQEERERCRHQRADVIEGARPRGAEERFQFGEGHFDRIQIAVVGREKAQVRPGLFNRRSAATTVCVSQWPQGV